jgi:hypothetical protein
MRQDEVLYKISQSVRSKLQPFFSTPMSRELLMHSTSHYRIRVYTPLPVNQN